MSFIQQFFTSRDNGANAETFVGQEGRLWWDPVTNQIYSSDGNTPGGIPLNGGGGGNGTPGGSNSQVQFNNNGSFGGTANLTIDSATGALTAVSFVGNGSTLTNITGANVVGEVAYAAIANSVAGANVTGTVTNATYADSAGTATTATSATTAGTVTIAAQPNITSVGTLTSITTTGNLTGGGLYVGGNGVVTGNLQIQGNLTYNNLTNITTANLVFGLANTSIGVSANGAGWVVGNTNEASILYNYSTQLWNSNIGISAAGNVIGSNISTAGVVSASGNITGNYFIGNGSQLTGIVSSYGNSNVTTLLAAGVGTNISTTGTVVAGNLNVTTAGNNLSVGHVQIFVANNTITTDNGSAVQFGVRVNTANIFATGLINATANIAGGNLTTPGQISAVGNITTLGNVNGNFYIGNGSLLTGITGTYGNTNVSTYLASGTNTSNIITTANIRAGNISAVGSINLGGLISAVGNITGGNLLTGANVSAFGNVTGGNIITSGLVSTVSNVVANYLVGNGAALYAVNGSNITGTVANATYAVSAGSATTATTAGTVTTAAQPNITSVGTLTSITSTGNISTTGNVTGNYFIGNGSLLTGIAASTYSNANVAAYLPTYTGNVAGAYFIGNGYTLTNVNASNVTGTVATASIAYSISGGTAGALVVQNGAGATGFITIAAANTILTSNGSSPNWTLRDSIAVGTVTASAQPNITSVGTLTSVTVTGNVDGGNINTSGLISATGNITGGNIIGTHIGNLSGTTASLSGNVTGGNFIGNGYTLTSVNASNVIGTVANATYAVSAGSATTATTAGTVTTNAQPNITSIGTLSSVTVTANVTGGNLLTGGLVSATGNITSGNVTTAGRVTTSTQVLTANGSLGTPGYAFSGDTDTGLFLLADGNLAVQTNAGTRAIFQDFGANVLGYITATGNVIGANVNTGGLVSATGNITGGNINTGGLVSATGNLTSGNVNTAGRVSATGNVNGNNIIGVGTISATGGTNSTAFAVGNSAVSNVALGMFPTAGTPGEFAIRDYSTVNTNLYFDACIGGTGTPTFTFRGTNAYTTYATINSTGLNMQSLAIQGQTPYLGKTSFNVALDTSVTVDNLKYRISNQGGVFPQIQGATGNVDICFSSVGYVNGATNPATSHSSGVIIGFGATWNTLYNAHGLDDRGDYLAFHLTDKSAGKIYRVTYLVTNNASNTTGYNIVVERIL